MATAILCLFVVAQTAVAQSNGFRSETFLFGNHQSMPYRIFVPRNHGHQKYPLVLWLHGSAGRGRDNLKSITGGNFTGSHFWAGDTNQRAYPCFVLAPQCPETTLWVSNDGIDTPPDQLDAVAALVHYVEGKYSIDTSRVYVVGQSMGGVAVWEIIARYPSLFAAALPLCAIGNTDNAKILTRTPVWVFHGTKDDVVPVSHAREMVDAIRRAGGNPKYSEYPEIGHDVWNVAFKEKDLPKWVFSQHRIP